MTRTPALLTRAAFHEKVLARSHGRCVVCGQLAVAAHHVLERKLFPDGGYYLDNGAAVCEAHHWDCETTVISVEAIRRASGITEAVIPPGLGTSALLDKWGNRIWPSGLRSWGPLGPDAGMRKALAAGRVLGLYMPCDYTEPVTGPTS